MFNNLCKTTLKGALSAALLLTLFGCAQDDAVIPSPESVDLSKTEDLFTTPAKPNPLTADPNDVVMRVNGEEITRAQMADVINQGLMMEIIRMIPAQQRQQIPPQYLAQVAQQQLSQMPSERRQQLQAQVIPMARQQIIDSTLMKAAAAAADIAVPAEEIEQDLIMYQSNNIPAGTDLTTFLAENKLSLEELKDSIKRQRSYVKFIESKTEDTPEATEADAKAFYTENQKNFTMKENASASHILIKVDADASDEVKAEKKALLEKIRADIIAGTISFEDAAKANSEDPGSKDKGGTYNGITRGQMVPEFDTAVFSQEIGEIGDVFSTTYGYHIVKVLDRQKAAVRPFEEIKEQLRLGLSRQKKQETLETYIKSLRDAATIEDLGM